MLDKHAGQWPALSAHAVHVWVANLDLPAAFLGNLSCVLSPGEHNRATRFYFERDRRRFIVARGILRHILSRYLDCAPDHVGLCYGRDGKPRLERASGAGDLRFNVSHSYGVALYGVTLEREIGVDIEHIRVLPDADQIAERFFSPRERAMLQAVHPTARTETFFNLWTRKEAYLKAVGKGLILALDSIEVSAVPGEPARLLSVPGDPREVGRWRLEAVSPPPGYIAAIAVERHDWELAAYVWPDLDQV